MTEQRYPMPPDAERPDHLAAERAQDEGYAALAADQDEEDRAYHAAMRSRRRERGEHEPG